MAGKEATIFIIDLGRSMGSCHNGRTETNLDWSMRYVWDKISNIAATSRKTLLVGILGVRTDETKNVMEDEAGYENISVLKELGPIGMTDLKKLTNQIKVSETDTGDAVSAIVLAIEMIGIVTKQLKYKRQIFLITDGIGPIDGDDFDDISAKINETGIELNVLSVLADPTCCISLTGAS